MPSFFLGLFSVCVWLNKPFAPYIFGVLAILGAGIVIIPMRMTRVYSVWLLIARLIGRVITTIMLSLGFYLVITPAGMIKRLFGGRPLPIKPNRNAATYWVKRSELAQPKESFIKRY